MVRKTIIPKLLLGYSLYFMATVTVDAGMVYTCRLPSENGMTTVFQETPCSEGDSRQLIVDGESQITKGIGRDDPENEIAAISSVVEEIRQNYPDRTVLADLSDYLKLKEKQIISYELEPPGKYSQSPENKPPKRLINLSDEDAWYIYTPWSNLCDSGITELCEQISRIGEIKAPAMRYQSRLNEDEKRRVFAEEDKKEGEKLRAMARKNREAEKKNKERTKMAALQGKTYSTSAGDYTARPADCMRDYSGNDLVELGTTSDDLRQIRGPVRRPPIVYGTRIDDQGRETLKVIWDYRNCAYVLATVTINGISAYRVIGYATFDEE